MIKKFFKPLIKKQKYTYNLLSYCIYLYLKIVYATSRLEFIFPVGYNQKEFLAEKGVIFALWHNRLALGPGIFRGNKNVHALVSPHSDGKIISSVIKKFGFGIIEGSTNKNPTKALRNIIQVLQKNGNMVITPDGPRGPVYNINSNITQIARKYATKLIPISCHVSGHYLMKTWDKLIMPLPFSSITVKIGHAINLTDQDLDNQKLLISQLR